MDDELTEDELQILEDQDLCILSGFVLLNGIHDLHVESTREVLQQLYEIGAMTRGLTFVSAAMESMHWLVTRAAQLGAVTREQIEAELRQYWTESDQRQQAKDRP